MSGYDQAARREEIGIVVGLVLGVAFAFMFRSCQSKERTLVVTATAYNSVPSQTQGNPDVAAWGDRLEPGMKVIAVSRDLLAEGLGRGTVVRIEGLEGEYVVLDKMRGDWARRIDIYMGVDLDVAREFGVQQKRISWRE